MYINAIKTNYTLKVQTIQVIFSLRSVYDGTTEGAGLKTTAQRSEFTAPVSLTPPTKPTNMCRDQFLK